jgi:hypothetical protein
MRNRAASLDIGEAPVDLLHHVEMVQDIVQRAIIWKAI